MAEIVTTFWMKPIPPRNFDWEACRDGYEPGDHIGYGATEEAAIADLRVWEESDEPDDTPEERARLAQVKAEEAEFDAYPPGGWDDETYEENE